MKSENDSSEYTIYITFSILMKLTGEKSFKQIFKKQNMLTQIQQKPNACVVYMCVKPKSQSINTNSDQPLHALSSFINQRIIKE